MKFSGSTMAYAMTISLVIATMLGSILAVNDHYRQILHGRYAEERAMENLRSGMAWLMSQNPAREETYAVELFESTRDSFYASAEDWGLLRLIHGEGVFARFRERRSCLAGQSIAASPAALIMNGVSQPLTVTGDTRIMGDAILGRTDIHSGRVGNRVYSGDQMVYGKIFQSSTNSHPVISENAVEPLKNILQNLPFPLPGVLQLKHIQAVQPWEGEGLEIVEKQSVVLDEVALSGKCRIISANQIVVSATAELEHCLLFARKIVIQKGFSGRVQAFATDTVEVEANVHLHYPSVVGVIKTDVTPVYMTLDTGAILEGELLFDPGETVIPRNADDYVLINPGSTVYGLVKIHHNLDLRGKVNGRVIAGNFLLKTPATVYFNYLMDAEINLGELSPEFSGAITDAGGWLKIIEWL